MSGFDLATSAMSLNNLSVGLLLNEKEQEVARLREQALTSLEAKARVLVFPNVVALQQVPTRPQAKLPAVCCSCMTENNSLSWLTTRSAAFCTVYSAMCQS